MRISDWSSDVCSSDLPGLVVAILSDRPVALVESRKRRCEFLRSVAGALDLGHVEVVEARLEALATRPAATISARAFAPLDRLPDLRSEEQTSELQSLMRTSYAVFCLYNNRTKEGNT